jgi:hypothetical protein
MTKTITSNTKMMLNTSRRLKFTRFHKPTIKPTNRPRFFSAIFASLQIGPKAYPMPRVSARATSHGHPHTGTMGTRA